MLHATFFKCNKQSPTPNQPLASRRLRSCAPRAQSAGSPLLIPYEAVEANEAYSVRLYTPCIVARTCYERRDEGFLRLGKYFDDAKLPQTQPVVMTYPDEASQPPHTPLPFTAEDFAERVCAPRRAARQWSYTSDPGRCGTLAYTLLLQESSLTCYYARRSQDPPAPSDEEVWLDAAGGELLAVLRLPGSATQQACDAGRRRLLDAVTRGRLQACGLLQCLDVGVQE